MRFIGAFVPSCWNNSGRIALDAGNVDAERGGITGAGVTFGFQQRHAAVLVARDSISCAGTCIGDEHFLF
jgi:hypothetical protein